MTKEEVDTIIESLHEDGTPMYKKYLSTIQAQTKCNPEQAMELFHHIYMNYVDEEHNDSYKYKSHQLAVFDAYISGMCQEFIWQKVKAEQKLEERHDDV